MPASMTLCTETSEVVSQNAQKAERDGRSYGVFMKLDGAPQVF